MKPFGFSLDRFGDHRVFLLAVFLSMAWHIFWIAAIRIVASPAPSKPVKFSSVSFLGPILTRGAIEVRVNPEEISFLERRYMEGTGMRQGPGRRYGDPVSRREMLDDSAKVRPNDEVEMVSLIDGSISGRKLDPPPDFE